MKRYRLYCLFVVCAFVLNSVKASVSTERDSLFQIWQTTSLSDSLRMSAMIEMIEKHYINTYQDSTQYYSELLREMATQGGFKYFEAKSLTYLGNLTFYKGEYEQAKDYLEKALTLWESLSIKEELTKIYNVLGLVNQDLGYKARSLEQFEKGIAIASELKDSVNIVNMLLNMAAVYESNGVVAKSLEYNERAFDISTHLKHQRLQAIAHNNLANNYKYLGDIEHSANQYLNAHAIYEDTEDQEGMLTTLNNLALLYIDNEEYSKAQDYLEEALSIAISNEFYQEQAMIEANFGHLYGAQDKFSEALNHFKKGLQIIEDNSMLYMLPFMQLNIGTTLIKMEDYEAAENYLVQGLDNSKKHGRAIDILSAYQDMSSLCVQQGKWADARSYALEGYRRAKEMKDIRQLQEFAVLLVSIHKHFGEYADALYMHEMQVQLKDSIYNEENTRSLIRQEYEYNFERKAYQDSLENVATLEIQASDLRRRKLAIWSLSGILVLVILLVVTLFNRYRIIRKQRERIKEEKEKAETANTKLLEMDRSKSRFFTNISHEFRTPLTVIAGMAEQVKEPARARKLIRRNTTQLLQLINQILDLRKLESGSLTTRYIQADVVSYMRYIIESFHSLAEEKLITLAFKSPVDALWLDYDPEKLMRILSNLLSNAIKFTPDGGTVSLSFETLPDSSDNHYQFVVSDNGVGIPKEKLPYIFDRFYQVGGPVSQPSEGTGIGLALIKELVHLMNGEIEAKSQEGEGTTITIQLPYTKKAPLQETPFEVVTTMPIAMNKEDIPQANGNTLTNEQAPSLLIVEDNPDVMEYLVMCLEDHYNLLFASDGQDGIDLAQQEIPDIIISDVMMPRADGFTLCNTLKNDQRTSHIPIVLLTAKADIDSRIVGLQRGADAYLAKPFDRRELHAQLNNLLTLRQRLQARYASLEQLDPSEDIAVQKEDEFITRLRRIFEARMDDPMFDLSALSKELLLSRSQLGRKVKALTGRTPAIYLRGLRLQKARQLLLNTDFSIKEVAYDVGFSDPSYFSKSYNEEFGEYPTITRNAI